MTHQLCAIQCRCNFIWQKFFMHSCIFVLESKVPQVLLNYFTLNPSNTHSTKFSTTQLSLGFYHCQGKVRTFHFQFQAL